MALHHGLVRHFSIYASQLTITYRCMLLFVGDRRSLNYVHYHMCQEHVEVALRAKDYEQAAFFFWKVFLLWMALA